MTEQRITRVQGSIDVACYQEEIEAAIIADESLRSRLLADVATVTARLERSRGKRELLNQMITDISQPQISAPVTALPQNGIEKEPFVELTEEREP